MSTRLKFDRAVARVKHVVRVGDDRKFKVGVGKEGSIEQDYAFRYNTIYRSGLKSFWSKLS